MSRDVDAVHEAIDRWTEGSLIDADTAAALHAEAARHAGSGAKRLSQYLVAASGGAALLLAGGVFVDWAWPLLDRAARSVLLAAAGVLVLILGVRLESERRWRPAAYLMQTAGLGLLFGGYSYSGGVWEDRSPGSILVGSIALATPVVLAPRAMKRNVVMPAVHLAMGLAFLAVFLDRATALSDEAIVWTLDAVLLASILVLLRMTLSDTSGERHPWALNAFVVAMLAGFVMILWTGIEVLSMSDDVVYPLDAWLGLSALLTLWGRHRAPEDLRREWLGRLLAGLVLLWIPFGAFTAYEQSLVGEAEAVLLLLGGAGVVAFMYGSRQRLRALMAAATLSFVLALWIWAVDRGGALGAVAALVATAGLLFWASGRLGGSDVPEGASQVEADAGSAGSPAGARDRPG